MRPVPVLKVDEERPQVHAPGEPARRFADVLATDYVPELLEEAGRRAEADGVVLTTQVADVQALPFEDAFRAVGEDGADDLAAELAGAYRSHSTAQDGTMAVDVPYREVVATRA